jgi:PAS domain S-box-containing protein
MPSSKSPSEASLTAPGADRAVAGDPGLRESEERFRKAFDQAAIGMAMTRPDGSWMKVNAALCDLLGYPQEELLDRRFLSLAHPEDREADEVHFRDALASDRDRFQLERRFLHRDGRVVWIALTTAIVRDERGAALYTLAQMEDITDRKRAEHELREREALLRGAFDDAPIGMALTALDGQWVRVNQALCEIVGYSESELLATTFQAITHPDDLPRSLELYRQLLAGERTRYQFEKRYVHRLGHDVWVSVTVALLLDEQGRPRHQLVQIQDVTERVVAAQALRAREERFRALTENTTELVSVLGSDGSIRYASPSYARLLGYEPAEMVGLDPFTLVHPDDVASCTTSFGRVLEQDGASLTLLFRVRSRDGEYHWLELSGRNLLGHPAIAGIVCTGRDVTERQQAEELRQRQTETLRVVFDHIPAMVSFTNAAGELAFVNGEWTRVTGWTLEEVRDVDFLAELYPDLEERTRARDFMRAATGSPDDFRMRTRDGRTIETTLAYIALSDGSVIGFGQDVTDRHHLEAQLRQAQKMEAVGRLAGGVAHDFNNLLTVIQTNAFFLLEDIESSDPRRQDVLQIRAAGERAAGLTRQLLAYSRQQLLQPRVVDVNRKVENVVAMLRRVIGEDIILETDLSPTVWPVFADPGQLEQVLMNLAVNARDAMPGGGTLRLRTAAVKIDAAGARAHPGLVPGQYTSLVVEDTGVGISPDVLPQIFEPFFTTKGTGMGTGLGLSTVYGIVRQSEGHIHVESAPGKGSRFTVLLPGHVEAGGEASNTAVATPPRGSERILLVEDELPVRTAVRRMLERLGYKVLEAASGAEALGILDTSLKRIDLVLTDVVMPDVDGRVLAECVAKGLRPPHVLYMSGYTDDDILRRGLTFPGTALLQKPFTSEALAHAVREVLDSQQSPAE